MSKLYEQCGNKGRKYGHWAMGCVQGPQAGRGLVIMTWVYKTMARKRSSVVRNWKYCPRRRGILRRKTPLQGEIR